MKNFALWTLVVLTLAVVTSVGLYRANLGGSVEVAYADENSPSLYEFTLESLEGEDVEMSQYRGKVALVVNVASKCGLTPQYKGLQALYEELGGDHFTILGFPSNDFMDQEPGSPAEIRAFCTKNYGVSFPLFAKRSVKGEDKDEVYRLLSAELEEPTWNFTKYLVDKEGRVVRRFAPRTAPDDAEMRAAIEELMKG